jgi:hypothetical protein
MEVNELEGLRNSVDKAKKSVQWLMVLRGDYKDFLILICYGL